MAGWADPEQVHVDGEDLVEVLASERQVGQIDMEQGSLTRGEVIGVALGRLLDRGRGPSIAVIFPPANCPHTSDPATPGPQPISRISSSGATFSTCTAHCRRWGGWKLTMRRASKPRAPGHAAAPGDESAA